MLIRMKSDWNAISETFSAVNDHYDSVFPMLCERLRQIQPQKLLDYGCGDGLFAHFCSQLPIQEIVIFDNAPHMISLAKEKCSEHPHIRVEEKTQHLPSENFDAVTFNAVWMCLSNHDDCVQTLKEVHRLLKINGYFFAAVTHPCFRNFDYAACRTDFAIKDYSQDGLPFKTQLSRNGKSIQFTDYHWTMGAMSRQLKESGFVIEEIVEIPEKDAHDEFKPGIPWMIIFAKKV
ncbi:MAG: class I SAM-dependent methyltransferase [Verrucomicrobiota bacterium]